MHKFHDVMRRSDRVFVAALTIVFVAVSAAVGAAAAYHPYAHKVRTTAVVAKAAPAPVVKPPKSALAKAEDLVKAKLLKEHRCLAQALYYEARGEGKMGQEAIAEVIFTRMRTGNYGNSICAVVYEGAGHAHCQFSFTCNGDLSQPKNPRSWIRAQELAARILTGEVRLKGVTDGATNYHATSVDPSWAGALQRTVQIGNHIFYKNRPRSRQL